MLPDRCTVMENGRRCVNPPEFIISVIAGSGEYMIGVACGRHKHAVSKKITALQNEGKIPAGRISLAPLRAVGTDCIRGHADDLIRID